MRQLTQLVGLGVILAVTGVALAAPVYADAEPGSGVQVSFDLPAKMGNNADPTEFAVTATNDTTTDYGRLRLDFTIAVAKSLGFQRLSLEEYVPRVDRWDPLPLMYLFDSHDDRGKTWGHDFALPAHGKVTIRMRLTTSLYFNDQAISTEVQVRRVTGVADPDPTPLATVSAQTALSFPSAEVSIKLTNTVYLPAGGPPYEFVLSTTDRTGSAYSHLGLYLQLHANDGTAGSARYRLECYDPALGWQPAQKMMDGTGATSYLTNAPTGGPVGDGQTMSVQLRLIISPDAPRQTFLLMQYRVGVVNGPNGNNWGWQPDTKAIGIV